MFIKTGNDMNDTKNCAMYICNGVAVDCANSGEFPTVEDLRSNWQAYKYAILTDEEIKHMLNLLKRYY